MPSQTTSDYSIQINGKNVQNNTKHGPLQKDMNDNEQLVEIRKISNKNNECDDKETHAEPNNLSSLLDIDLNMKKKQLNSTAIIEELRKNPNAAASKYHFSTSSTGIQRNSKCLCYPLHRAIILKADIEVIEAIYSSYPSAIEENVKSLDDNTALHLAIHNKASAQVTSFLLDKYPAAAQATNQKGNVPLHDACINATSIEIVSLLLRAWPDAVKATNSTGITPLHLAAWNSACKSLDVLSLLLSYWPQAAKAKDNYGNTPLHCACHERASLDVMSLLLEYAPEAVKEQDSYGKTPLVIYTEKCDERRECESGKGLLSYMYDLCGYSKENDIINEEERVKQLFSCFSRLTDGEISSKEMMDYFIEIEWWNGVLMMFDEYPSLRRHMNIDEKVLPHLLSAVGRSGNMKRMWLVLSNELDIIEGI